jgi:hypothetical protein
MHPRHLLPGDRHNQLLRHEGPGWPGGGNNTPPLPCTGWTAPAFRTQVRRSPAVVPTTPQPPANERLGRRLGCLPDAKLPAAKPRAGGRRWLPDVQPPTLDGSPRVGGHPRADLVDHQPRVQGHYLWIDRDRLPRAEPARGRDPLARMAGHLEDAELYPSSAGGARRRQFLPGPGRAQWWGRGRVPSTAGGQEDPSSDCAEQGNPRCPHAAAVASADRHRGSCRKGVSGALSRQG